MGKNQKMFKPIVEKERKKTEIVFILKNVTDYLVRNVVLAFSAVCFVQIEKIFLSAGLS